MSNYYDNCNWELYEQCKTLLYKYIKRYSRYLGSALDEDDLLQVGMMGLIKALSKYDPGMKASFKTYAAYWVMEAMLKELEHNNYSIRLPKYKQQELQKIMRVKYKYAEVQDEDRCIDLIADELDLPAEKVEEYLSLSYRMQTLPSLDLISENEIACWEPFESMEDIFEKIEMRRLLEDAFQILTDREVAVLKMRFGWDGQEAKTYKEIGEVLNITGSGACQIEKKALAKIRKSDKCSILEEFLAA